MNILIYIKQVPGMTEIRIDPVKRTLIHEGVPSIVSPFDTCALEMAVRLKEKEGRKAMAVSMGPAQTKSTLRECPLVRANQAFLVMDWASGGSDTLATSYMLSRAVRVMGQRAGESIDVVSCGKQAISGDTAQVGPEMAEHTDFPHATLATGVEIADGKLRVQKDTDESHDIIEAGPPALVTVTKTSYSPRYPFIKSKIATNKAVITEITNSDPDMICDQERLGFDGSPTKVKKAFILNQTKNGVTISNKTGPDAAAKLAAMLNDAKTI